MLIAGLALLVVGAEALVRGASKIAAAVGISPLVIGLTVVAFGTSAPELAVGAQAALSGNGDIALGNVIGSNIFNILVIIGLSAIIVPLVVHQQLVRWDVPLVIALSVLVLILGLDGKLGRIEGALLFLGLIAFVGYEIWHGRRESEEVQQEYAQEYGDGRGKSLAQWALNGALLVAGLAMLIVGANWLVDSSTAIARSLGVSELVIGLTIVAAGTSAPEMATSAMAALRAGHRRGQRHRQQRLQHPGCTGADRGASPQRHRRARERAALRHPGDDRRGRGCAAHLLHWLHHRSLGGRAFPDPVRRLCALPAPGCH